MAETKAMDSLRMRRKALLSVVQQRNHVVDGKVVQVKVAGPRPVQETQPGVSPCTNRNPDFGRGFYIGGVADAVTKEDIQQHFAKWGDILDVYLPAARGLCKRRYCFVTFGNHDSAQQAYKQSERSINGWPLKSINVAEDRKDDGHQLSPQSGKISSSGCLEVAASATLQMPLASDSASLFGCECWLQLQYQKALRQLAAVEATASLPHYSHICSQNRLGLESLPQGMSANQVYWSAPNACNNSPPLSQAAGACQNWNGMRFPLPGSSLECTGEMEGFLGRTDTSLSSEYVARLAQSSTLQASGQECRGFSGGEDSIPLPSLQEQYFDGRDYPFLPHN